MKNASLKFSPCGHRILVKPGIEPDGLEDTEEPSDEGLVGPFVT
jgi:hypothetical protein